MIVSLADVLYARSRYRWRQFLKISSTAAGVYEYPEYEGLRTKSPSRHVRVSGVIGDYFIFYSKRCWLKTPNVYLPLRGYE